MSTYLSAGGRDDDDQDMATIALDARSTNRGTSIVISRRALAIVASLLGVVLFSLVVAVGVSNTRVQHLRSKVVELSAKVGNATDGDGARGGGGATAERAKNVIFFVTDGMGPATVTAARGVRGARDLNDPADGQLRVDPFFVGKSQTRSLNSPVTDSAAGATALSTGYRTWNQRDAVDGSGKAVGTLLEAMMRKGGAAGVVVTTDVIDATPASFTTHAIFRKLNDFIALKQSEVGLSVLMGGGRKFFTKEGRADGRDLLADMKSRGYTVATDAAGLRSATSPANVPFVGLFADRDMAYEIDRDPGQEPSLEEMTTRAIEMITSTEAAKENGFFLLVEASRIDHAGHSNDVAANVGDTLEWDKAITVAIEFAKRSGDTLVFSTSDHETGGLSLGGGSLVPRGESQYSRFGGVVGAGDPTKVSSPLGSNLLLDRLLTPAVGAGLDAVYPYFWVPDFVGAVKHSSSFTAAAVMDSMAAAGNGPVGSLAVLSRAEAERVVAANFGSAVQTLTDGEWEVLSTAMATCVARTCNATATLTAAESKYGRTIEYALNAIVSRRANVDWTTHAHSGVDVNVYAFGPGRDALVGSRPNKDYATLIAEIADLDLAAATAAVTDNDVGKCPYQDARCAPDTRRSMRSRREQGLRHIRGSPMNED